MKKQHFFSIIGIGAALLMGCSKSDPLTDYRKVLAFHEGFSLLWLTDLHWGNKASGVDYAVETAHFQSILQDASKEKVPDLLVFTGDVFQNENEADVDAFFALVENSGIPWAFTFGNHDQTPFLQDPDFLPRKIKACPHAIYANPSNDGLTGNANYFINLVTAGKTKYRLYLIDSNSYKNPADSSSGYDIIHSEQLNHVKSIVSEEGPAPGLAFFHIPLRNTPMLIFAIFRNKTKAMARMGRIPAQAMRTMGPTPSSKARDQRLFLRP
jgi:hypothetical protein